MIFSRFLFVVLVGTLLAGCGKPYKPTSEIPRESWPKLESTHATYIEKVDGDYIPGYVIGVSGIVGGNTVEMPPGKHIVQIKVSSGTEDRIYQLPLNLEQDTGYEVHQRDWASFQVVIMNKKTKRIWVFHPATGAYYAAGQPQPPELGHLIP